MSKLFYTLWIIILSSHVWAGTTGKLAGVATDARTKGPLIGANIILEGTVYGAATDFEGNYVILNIPPGKYRVRVSSIGYRQIAMENVAISIDLTTTRNFELSESQVEMGEVVVEAKTEVLKKDVTSSQATISFEQIKNLPVAELTDVLELQAGVSRDADGGFHIRGGRTTEIAYWVNGISITDAYDNSQGIKIDNSSVQELQVISGTFNAEYGNAMSGIVNTVTKEGGRDYHGNVVVYGGDHLSNFTEYFPHIDNINAIANYNFQGSLSGHVPFTNNALAFFANGRYYYDDGYLFGERRYNVNGTKGDGKVVSMNWHKNLYGQGNVSYAPISELKLNLEGLYSKENFQDYNHEYRWNPSGNVKKYSESYSTTATMTHMLSSSSFYTIKSSYFNKDFNEYVYKNTSDPRYQHPDSLNIIQYAFRTKGTNLHRFYRKTQTYVGKIDFTSQATETHLIKVGSEVKSHSLNFDDYTLEPLRINGSPVEPFQPSIPGEDQTNRVEYRNEPFEASAYIQDKIEFESVIINIGLRLDYFDANGKVLVDVTDPNIYAPLRLEMAPLTVKEREPYFYKDSEAKFQISPRFGIAYPITETGVVHFSYGHFLQVPPFQFLFQNGPYKVPNSGVFVGVYGNPNLEAQKTVMYEIGLRQEFFDNYLIDVTGFYRDVRDWITAGSVIQTRNLVTYSIFTNKDYANVKGITLTLNRQFTNNFSFDLNYTYQVAEGSNSKPEEEFEAAKGSGEPSLFLIPMDWDQNHLLNANLSVGADGWRGSLLARYGTGTPYSPTTTIYTRVIGSGLQKNSRRIPSQFSMDLRLDKTIQLMGLEITLFTRIFNLLDNKIPLRVFTDSGKPDFTTEGQDVGYNASRPNTVEEYLKNPDRYGEPRNVQFGFEFSF